MRRYALTGELVDPTSRATRHGAFMDCLTAPDSYLDAQNRVLRASEAFQSLPSAVRARFQGSVPALLEFISDPANTEEAIFLGLCEKPASQPPAAAD
ncbi:MAG: internal scaffolding protein [Microviridae sp.]|nr:MAG: internal scaffolding protein [Microviridae sp.]